MSVSLQKISIFMLFIFLLLSGCTNHNTERLKEESLENQSQSTANENALSSVTEESIANESSENQVQSETDENIEENLYSDFTNNYFVREIIPNENLPFKELENAPLLYPNVVLSMHNRLANDELDVSAIPQYEALINQTKADMNDMDFDYNIASIDIDLNNDGIPEKITYISSLIFSQNGNFFLDIWEKTGNENEKYSLIGKTGLYIKNPLGADHQFALGVLDYYIDGYLVFVTYNDERITQYHYYSKNQGCYVRTTVD